MLHERQYEVAARLAERERKAGVANIQKQLHAQPVNESGLCSDCDEAIAPARLENTPTAQRCIDCQNTYEFKERQGHV